MLVYPDPYVIRFFYKKNLGNSAGRLKVLELGCGEGNNLELFALNGFHCFGVDINKGSIETSKRRFEQLRSDSVGDFNDLFITHDLNNTLPKEIMNDSFDVILLPSLTYYLESDSREQIMQFSREQVLSMATPNFFMRERLSDDGRTSLCTKLADGRFRMISEITGERGAILNLLTEQELLHLAHSYFSEFKNKFVFLDVRYQNLQNEKIINNHDQIFWI